MKQKTLGIVREGYSKWERRSPLTPKHVSRAVKEQGLRVLVQPSTLRVFTNDEFKRAGAEISEDLSACDAIVGVKQVEIGSILPEKTYVFFSHTIKAQESNMKLLDKILEKKVRLIDHECIRNQDTGERLVAFGDYAGRAGMLESLRGLGIRLLGMGYSTPFLNLGPAYSYKSLDDAMRAASAVCEDYSAGGGARSFLPPGFGPMCFIFTGSGKVSRGAQAVFEALPNIEMLSSIDDLRTRKTDEKKIYGLTVRDVDVMRKQSDPSAPIDRSDYLSNPSTYTCELFATKVLPHANLVLTGAYWDARYPRWMPNSPIIVKNSSKLLMVSDVSCDINGTFEGLSRSTTIEDPYYYVDFADRMKEVSKDQLISKVKTETDTNLKLVMGVDILPSELPREASQHFGDCLFPFLPQLCSGKDFGPVLERATIAKDGALTQAYSYIGKMRAERERSKKMASSIREDEEKKTRMIKLQGHLFDTRLINRVLDLIENKHGKFQIVQASLAQPRGGPGRELRAHTAVLLKLVGSSDENATEDLITAIERLVKESPAEAEASVTLMSSSEAASALMDLQGGDRSRKESASFGHLERVSSSPASRPSSNTEDSDIVILGSGMVSAPAIEYLARSNPKTLVRVVGGDKNEVDALRRRFVGKGSSTMGNVSVEHHLIGGVSSVDALLDDRKTKCVVSLLPAPMHLEVAAACISHRVPLVTASYVGKMRELYHAKAQQVKVPILCEMGLDPGMDHMSCMKVLEEHGGGKELVEFESYCGGLPAPEWANNPLGYKLSWSPRGVLTALKNPAKFKLQGQIVEERSILSARRPFELSGYANPSLRLEAIPNRDSTIYAEPYGVSISETSTFIRGTLRFVGFCEVMKDFEDSDLLDETPKSAQTLKCATWGDFIDARPELSERTRAFIYPYRDLHIDGSLSRLDALCELLKISLKMGPNERDLVVMEHRFRFKSGNTRLSSNLIVFGNEKDSAMARTVGLTAAVGAQLIIDGRHPGTGGVHIPTERWVYAECLKRLESEGLHFRESKL